MIHNDLSRLFDQAGGRKVIAQTCNCTESNVSIWVKQECVPLKYVSTLIKLFNDTALYLTPKDMETLNPLAYWPEPATKPKNKRKTK